MASATSVTTSATTQYFPTVTATSASVPGSGTNPTVYYFVFLGVLLVLLGAAGCLAFRAYRLRRRYRTARQLAIARGDPIPAFQEDAYWGLGNLSAWTSDGVDRLGGPQNGEIEIAGRKGKKGRWEKIPVLQDYQVEDASLEKGGGMDDAQPITLHSMHTAPKAPFADWANSPPPEGFDRRASRFRIRTNAFMDFNGPGSILASRRNQRRNRHLDHSDAPPPTPAPDPPMRTPEVGESVRVAVVIKMPREPSDEKTTKSVASTDGDDDEGDEEEVGWEPGMEIAVWEGVIADFEADRRKAAEELARKNPRPEGSPSSPRRLSFGLSPRRHRTRDSVEKG